MYYVYLLRSKDQYDNFYIGFSADLKRRVAEHNSGSNKSTSGRQWELVYYESYLVKKAAVDRERILKHDGRVRRFLMDRIKKHLE